MTLNAGQLDQRLTLQAPTAVDDALGQPVRTWVDQATVWGSARPLRGREIAAADGTVNDATVIFIIRHRSDVTRTWRVLWRGVAYGIVSDPIDINGQRTALELVCSSARGAA